MDSKMKKVAKFKVCNNDEDRVKLMLNDLDYHLRVMGECPYGRKSEGESEKFRHSGNLLFNSLSPDLEKILKLYSKSILYAPPGSEELSLAYANRSAVLFEGKYYEECLEDINRALNAGYPDSLKPKLLIRKVRCNYALTGNVDFETDEGLIEARALIGKLAATNKMRKIIEDTLNDPKKITSVGRHVRKAHPKYQPEMKGKNPNLPGASDAIALRYSEEYGRHLVATRNISCGEVLIIERPYATIVDDEWIYCICSHCARRTWNGIPCDYCIHAMFCSAECKLAAWEEYHDVECEIVGLAKRTGAQNQGLLGLRITVKAIKEAGTVGALRKRLKELDFVKVSDVEVPIDPNSYETFYTMSDYPERGELEDLMIRSLAAGSITYLLAVRTNLFGKKVVGSLRVMRDSEQFMFVAGLMLKNIRIAQNRSYGWKAEDEIILEDNEILTTLPVSSFFNNRCYDAAEGFRFDKDVVLITHVPINKGDQVFTHYYGTYVYSSRDERRKMLRDGWQFDCNCLACNDNLSTSNSTFWTIQALPPRIVGEIRDEVIKFQCLSLEEKRDPMKMIPVKETFCRLLNFVYPRMKKPCRDVEVLGSIIDDIHRKLSCTTYSRFVDEFCRSSHDVNNF